MGENVSSEAELQRQTGGGGGGIGSFDPPPAWLRGPAILDLTDILPHITCYRHPALQLMPTANTVHKW